jgi:hypothetical protein
MFWALKRKRRCERETRRRKKNKRTKKRKKTERTKKNEEGGEKTHPSRKPRARGTLRGGERSGSLCRRSGTRPGAQAGPSPGRRQRFWPAAGWFEEAVREERKESESF